MALGRRKREKQLDQAIANHVVDMAAQHAVHLCSNEVLRVDDDDVVAQSFGYAPNYDQGSEITPTCFIVTEKRLIWSLMGSDEAKSLSIKRLISIERGSDAQHDHLDVWRLLSPLHGLQHFWLADEVATAVVSRAKKR